MVRPIKRLQLGKAGLTSAFIEQVKSVFEKERVLKIIILRSCCRDKKGAERIGRRLVCLLGKKYDFKLVGYVLTIVRYRKERR